MLRRLSLVLSFVLGALACAPLRAAAADGPPSSPPSIEQWGIFELALSGPSDANPFMDVALSARFTHGNITVDVPGFYDGGGTYRIRFMPPEQGEWQYVTTSSTPTLAGKRGQFTVGPPGPGNHGPVRVANTFHFAYADGTPYFPIGTTCYRFTHMGEARQEQTLRTLAASPFNKVRLLVLPTEPPAASAPFSSPFAGTPPKDWDYTRFNPEFFRALERRIGQLRDLGIEADVILHSPYDRGRLGFDRLPADVDERYARYLVARLGAYRNVWWSLANEYDLMREKTEADWDKLFQVVQAADAHHHLLSIHHSQLIYNNSQPWVTHASIQNGAAVEDAGRAELYRDVWRKPVVFDEVKYEGNVDRRWGQLTGPEMVQRFWEGTLGGTYVGHGEVLESRPPGPQWESTWTDGGGELHGESPARIAFLRSIIEGAPAEGIDPIDKWQDSRLAGQPGKYYLLYFGAAKPASWTFALPSPGLSDGQTFQVDLLDTWNMTVTPLPGTYTVKRRDRYTFVDAEGRSIPLSEKPWLALRMRKVEK